MYSVPGRGGGYGGRPGQRVKEQGTWAAQKHSEAGYGRPVDKGVWTAKTVKRPRQQPAHPRYAHYWAPLTRTRHAMPHSAQPQHTNYYGDPTQHAKGRTGDRPGPRKGATTRRNVTRGGGLQGPYDVALCVRECHELRLADGAHSVVVVGRWQLLLLIAAGLLLVGVLPTGHFRV